MIDDELHGAMDKVEQALNELWPAVGFMRSTESHPTLSLSRNEPETLERLRVALKGGAK